MLNNIKKHLKWTQDWENGTKALTYKEIKHEFKKGEKKLKDNAFEGDEIIADAGEKIKVNKSELILAQIKQQKKVVEDKLTELNNKSGNDNDIIEVFKTFDELDKQLNDNTDGWKITANKQTYIDAYNNFLKGDATNGWGIGTGTLEHAGYFAVYKDYLERKYLKYNATGTPTEDYKDNLYQGTFRTGLLGNNHVSLKITENEAVKLITRTVKEIGEVDVAKFTAYVNESGTKLPTGSEYPTATFNKTSVITWMTDIHERAKYLQDNTIKTDNHPNKGKPANGKRVEYSFGDDFTDESGNSKARDNSTSADKPFTDTELKGLFNLMKVLNTSDFKSNSNNNTNYQTAFAKVKDAKLIMLPAETTPIKSSKLKELGVIGYVDNNGNSNFYATDYGTRISDGSKYRSVEYSWDTQFEVPVENGIDGWATLINSFSQEQYQDDKNKNKLISSFKDDPIKKFFDDIRNFDEWSRWGATNQFTYYDFPNWLYLAEKKYYQLKTKKKTMLNRGEKDDEEITKLEGEYQQERDKLFTLEAEYEKIITDKRDELRTKLKTDFKVDASTTPNFGNGTDATDTNRLTGAKHYELRQIIKNIRYLTSYDEEKPTGIKNEDDAYTLSEGITDKAAKDFYSVNHGWLHFPKDIMSGSGEVCKTDEERIAIIKEGKNDYQQQNLSWYHGKFEELEKLIVLEDWQKTAKTKIKSAIDTRDPQENMNDWRNSLKQYDSSLETVLTDDKIKEWQKDKEGQKAFNDVAGLETLIKKVAVMKDDPADSTKKVFDKVNDDFITFIGGKDSKLKTLSDLFKEKAPNEVILLIHQWEYNKLDDTNKKERHKKFAWSKLGGEKKVDEYELTEDDKKAGSNFEKFLYECAVGKINYSTLTKPAEEKKDDDNKNNEEKGGIMNHLGKYWYWYLGGTILFVGLGIAIFWKNISGWWNGPTEEPESTEGEEESKTESNE